MRFTKFAINFRNIVIRFLNTHAVHKDEEKKCLHTMASEFFREASVLFLVFILLEPFLDSRPWATNNMLYYGTLTAALFFLIGLLLGLKGEHHA
jgi:hypothetical protein